MGIELEIVLYGDVKPCDGDRHRIALDRYACQCGYVTTGVSGAATAEQRGAGGKPSGNGNDSPLPAYVRGYQD